MLIAGIDEGNKGEALNSIIVVCCYTQNPIEHIPLLNDSKTYLQKDMVNLESFMEKHMISYKVLEIKPQDLVEKLLNKMIIAKQIQLMKEVKADLFYVDSLQTNTKKLETLYKKEVKSEFVVENKLDLINPLVSLASLVALKVKRENLAILEAKVNEKVGSGNLRDPLTVGYIKKYYPSVPHLKKHWNLQSVWTYKE